MRGPKHGVGHAADEEGHPGPLPAHGRQEPRQLRARLGRRRQQRQHASQPAGHQLQEPQPLRGVEQPHPLRQPHGGQQTAACARHRGTARNRITARNQSKRFSEPRVGLLASPGETARSAGRNATPEGQAVSHARQSRHNSRCRRMRSVSVGAAVGHHPHQLDAAAGAVVLVAQFGVGRATRRAQPAVNAAQQ